MKDTIRVFVVDDSALVRHRLRAIINSTPGFEVIGSATSGVDCLSQLPNLQPDVVTLDVWMPEMDGLATLRQIMQDCPTPVVMVSALTEEGAQVTLDALALGAVDCLTKPSALSTDSTTPFASELRHKLTAAAQVSKAHLIRAMAAAQRRASLENVTSPGTEARSRGATALSPLDRPRAASPLSSHSPVEGPVHRPPAANSMRGDSSATPDRIASLAGRFTMRTRRALRGNAALPLVVIGSSTGGPQVLDGLFTDMADELPAAFVVVQHMPPLFTRSLATRLGRRTAMEVREAEEGDELASGLVLVAPGGYHVVLGADGRLHLDQSAPVHNVRPAIDRTLLSLVDRWPGRCLVVILTGMGVDGAEGARVLHARGASVFAQDEETSIVYGMPRAVVEAGAADAVLPAPKIGAAISRWALVEQAAVLSTA